MAKKLVPRKESDTSKVYLPEAVQSARELGGVQGVGKVLGSLMKKPHPVTGESIDFNQYKAFLRGVKWNKPENRELTNQYRRIIGDEPKSISIDKYLNQYYDTESDRIRSTLYEQGSGYVQSNPTITEVTSDRQPLIKTSTEGHELRNKKYGNLLDKQNKYLGLNPKEDLTSLMKTRIDN